MNLSKYAQLFNRLMAEAEPAGQPGGSPPAAEPVASEPATPPSGEQDPAAGGEPAVGPEGEPPAGGESDGDGEGGDNSVDFANLEMPDGMVLDDAAVEQFGSVIKELGLNQEQTQKMATAYAQLQQAKAQEAGEAFSQQLDHWYEQSATDKEFGGDKFEQSAKLAVQAVEKFGGPELKQVLEDTGLGNHPEVIRFMYRVGKAVSEDNPGSGGNGPTEKRDRASVLYPE